MSLAYRRLHVAMIRPAGRSRPGAVPRFFAVGHEPAEVAGTRELGYSDITSSLSVSGVPTVPVGGRKSEPVPGLSLLLHA